MAPIIREVRVKKRPGRLLEFSCSNDLSSDGDEESDDVSCSGTDSEVEEVSRRVVSLSVADVLSVAESPSFSLPTFIPAQDQFSNGGFYLVKILFFS